MSLYELFADVKGRRYVFDGRPTKHLDGASRDQERTRERPSLPLGVTVGRKVAPRLPRQQVLPLGQGHPPT